jgi:RHS repeat-associated protein
LRILGAGLQAEIGAAIALELQGKTYAPIHDCQGHLVCLIDPLNGQAVESYRYSAFGEEIIFNSQGQQVTDSQVGNPWRFASKRLDPETGWIYFGRRYYDPLIERWTTPDPLSFADGPNLYSLQFKMRKKNRKLLINFVEVIKIKYLINNEIEKCFSLK